MGIMYLCGESSFGHVLFVRASIASGTLIGPIVRALTAPRDKPGSTIDCTECSKRDFATQIRISVLVYCSFN